MFYSFGGPDTIGASPEVARDMLIADRNRCLTDLIYNSFFEREIESFRFALIEQRNNFNLTYGTATYDDLRHIIFALLESTDKFLKLFPRANSALPETLSHTMKQEMRVGAGIPPISSKENAGCDGVHGSDIMKNDLNGNGTEKVKKSDSSIDESSTGGK